MLDIFLKIMLYYNWKGVYFLKKEITYVLVHVVYKLTALYYRTYEDIINIALWPIVYFSIYIILKRLSSLINKRRKLLRMLFTSYFNSLTDKQLMDINGETRNLFEDVGYAVGYVIGRVVREVNYYADR